ncbi:MAG: glycosyltransferase [Lewinellaceae bacterium]|nr:glycosyltransferase [Lewinellaceae bacterium]
MARLYQECFPKVDGFHAVSNAISEEAQKWGAAKNKIKVIYSGIDLNKIRTYQKKEWCFKNLFNYSLWYCFHWKKATTMHWMLFAFYSTKDIISIIL